MNNYQQGRSWFEQSIAPAIDVADLMANATLTLGATTETGKRIISNTYSYPTNSPTLRITAARIRSNYGGPLITLAYYANPLASQIVSSIDSPNIVELDFNYAPDGGSVSSSSFQIIGSSGGAASGSVSMIGSTTARLTLASPLAAGRYVIIAIGTNTPAITLSSIPLDGKALMLPTGSGSSGGDFVASFDVISSPVIHPTTPPPLLSSSLWEPNYFALTGSPTCVALHSDNQLMVANAYQWNFARQTFNPNAQIPPPLSTWIYLREGEQWQMNIPIDLGFESFSDLQLSFILNASTRGTFRARVPVIAFSNTYTGVVTLSLTLLRLGFFALGLRAINSSGVSSMFEMKCIIEP
jgi:hypothetical protein